MQKFGVQKHRLEEFQRVRDCVNFPKLSPLLTFVFFLYFDLEIDHGTDNYSKGFSIYIFIYFQLF